MFKGIEKIRFDEYGDANEIRIHLAEKDWMADWAIMHGADGYRLERMPMVFDTGNGEPFNLSDII